MYCMLVFLNVFVYLFSFAAIIIVIMRGNRQTRFVSSSQLNLPHTKIITHQLEQRPRISIGKKERKEDQLLLILLVYGSIKVCDSFFFYTKSRAVEEEFYCYCQPLREWFSSHHTCPLGCHHIPPFKVSRRPPAVTQFKLGLWD